jgi:hypothetical protein
VVALGLGDGLGLTGLLVGAPAPPAVFKIVEDIFFVNEVTESHPVSRKIPQTRDEHSGKLF